MLSEWVKGEEDMTLTITLETSENKKSIWSYKLKCVKGTCLNIQFTYFPFNMYFWVTHLSVGTAGLSPKLV